MHAIKIIGARRFKKSIFGWCLLIASIGGAWAETSGSEVGIGPNGYSGAWSGQSDSIVFWTRWGESLDVYSVRSDGSDLSNLTNHPGEDANPVFSPDGKSIAFFSKRDDGVAGEIYLMNSNGSEVRNLTRHPSHDYNPTWSPDGRQIAFQSYRDGRAQIYVMESDGSGQRRMADSAHNDTNPAWSPDGRRIAYVSDASGIKQIHVMGTDGHDTKRIQWSSLTSENPKWSPDGRSLVFFTIENPGQDEFCNIMRMNEDGSAITRLTSHRQGCAFNPFWSPCGDKIVFSFGPYDAIELVVIDADGGDPVVIARRPR